MPKIIVLKPFAFAHRGIEVEELHPSPEPRDATQELVDHDGLVSEGYIEIVGEPAESGDADEAAEAEAKGDGNEPAAERKPATRKKG